MDRLGNFFFGSFERTRGSIVFIVILSSIIWILNNQVKITDFFNEIINFLYNTILPAALWIGVAIYCMYLGFSFITKPFRSNGKRK